MKMIFFRHTTPYLSVCNKALFVCCIKYGIAIEYILST